MKRMLEMVARFFLTLIGLLLAMFVMRLVVGEARRAARVPRHPAQPGGARENAALLKQDPVTGIYRPD
jgi:hypothetical protein